MRTGVVAFSTRLDQRVPATQIRQRSLEAQQAAHVIVETLLVEGQRNLVERVRVDRAGDGFDRHVAQVRDLLLQAFGHRAVAAQHDHVGLDAAAAQLGDRVLRRLRLLLARRVEVNHERAVQVQHVVASDVLTELPDRFEKRKDLDVADRAADLGDHDVDVVGRQASDAVLDLVGDVRDHLHGLAEEVRRGARWRSPTSRSNPSWRSSFAATPRR